MVFVAWSKLLISNVESELYLTLTAHPSCVYCRHEAAVSLVGHLSNVLTAVYFIVTLHSECQVLNDAANVARLIPDIIEA